MFRDHYLEPFSHFDSSQLRLQKAGLSDFETKPEKQSKKLRYRVKWSGKNEDPGNARKALQWAVSWGHFLFHRPTGQNGADGATVRAETTAPPGAKSPYRQTQT